MKSPPPSFSEIALFRFLMLAHDDQNKGRSTSELTRQAAIDAEEILKSWEAETQS